MSMEKLTICQLSSFSMTILVYLQVAWAYRLNGTAGDSQKFQDFLLVNYIVENFVRLPTCASNF